MFLRKNKAYTPSMRFTLLVDKRYLVNPPINYFYVGFKKNQGINHTGKKTVRHKGGSHKRKFIILDKNRSYNYNIPYKVLNICYDPNRSSFIALIFSLNGLYSYIYSSKGLFVGSILYNWEQQYQTISEGDHLTLRFLPFGMFFFNLNKMNNQGYNIAKSAGTFCLFINKIEDTDQALIRIPSGKRITVNMKLRATVGICSNIKHKYEIIGKAGRNRNKGIRPHVRGVAMNPIDHPHGGGEGKKSARVCPFSPWRKQPFFKKKK